MTVADIAIMYLRMGQSLEEIAGKYQLSLASVYAAIAFYYENKDDIDNQIQADEAFVEAFQRDNPSKLRQKLKALNSERFAHAIGCAAVYVAYDGRTVAITFGLTFDTPLDSCRTCA